MAGSNWVDIPNQVRFFLPISSRVTILVGSFSIMLLFH